MLDQFRQDTRIPLVLIGLMVLWLALYLVDISGDFSVPQPSDLIVPARVLPLAPISQWHIFGVYDASLDNVPLTQLQLTLQGVMVSLNQPGGSYAIIASPSVPAKAYRVGDTLPGDATLKKVLPKQIVISYQGMLQRLDLPVNALNLGS